MKLQKGLKIISIILLEGIFLLTGGILGLQSERNRIEQEEQAEVVTDIAIVNLDEGIYKNSKKIYYSTELMDMEAGNFALENLETARQGINNGNYAAYILIPAEFSVNALSINSVPQKSVLEFAVNPNLREDVSRLTMANIKNFEISLNTNMSYMYVQAILEEFHNVQDSAGILMNNDDAELARLLKIVPEELMEEIELPEIEQVRADIEDVDFDEAFETNVQITTDLQDNYEHFVSEGEEAFEKIKENENTVMEGIDSLYAVLAEVDVETDTEGNLVYSEGLVSLEEYLEQYNLEFEEQKNKIAQKVNVSIESPVPSDAPIIPELLEKMLTNELVGVNERITEVNKRNKEKLKEAEEIIETIRLLLNGTAQTYTLTEDEGEQEITNETEQENLEETVKEERQDAQEIVVETEQQASQKNNEEVEKQELKETTEEIEQKIQQDAAEEEAGQELRQNDVETEQTQKEDIEEATSVQFILYAAENPSDYARAGKDEILIQLDELENLLESIEDIGNITSNEVYDVEIIKKEFDSLMAEIENLPQMDTTEYNDIFENEVLKPLEDEAEAENAKIQDASSKCMETMSSYMEEMALFNPYEYYDYERMDGLLTDFGENIFNLEDKVYQTHEEYVNYVFDAVDMTNESMALLQEDLEGAYEGTADNVQREVDLAKQYRQEMNETNIEILNDFSQKLPYTRIGNLEYVQTYDFMVKPIKMSDASVNKSRGMILEDYGALRTALVVMTIMLLLSVCGLFFVKNRVESEGNQDK